jgi:hypothetical protein
VLLSYQYALRYGGDSKYYWGQNSTLNHHSWLDFFHYGSNSILFINYPFITLGLPLGFGFLLYGLMGYWAIVKALQWAVAVFGEVFYYKKINLLWLVFMLPNLHFWTATLGKEPLVFYGIAAVFYAMATHRYQTWSFLLGSLALVIVRPHVALMLGLAIVVVLLLDKKTTFKTKVIMAVIALIGLNLLLYWSLQLSKIYFIDWKRIQYYNDFSILSFQKSGSYVPMLSYSYPYKLFSFCFRPLFFDAYSITTILASLENTILLGLCGMAFLLGIKYYSKLHFPNGIKIAFMFAAVALLLYVERYANLGIFMRTKIMFEPFAAVGLLYICKQGIQQMKSAQ